MKRKVFLFLISLAAILGLHAQDIVFKCEAPEVIGLHERFKVVFTVNSKDPSNFQAPTFQNVNILGGPSTSRSSSISIINGKRSENNSTSFVFWLQSLTTGKIIIPSAHVKVNGKTYSTKARTISVEDNPTMSQRSGNSQQGQTMQQQPTVKVVDDKAVFVRAIPSKTKVVKGEEIVISYKIYTLVPVSEYQVEKFPSSQGFWVEELDNQVTPSLEKEIIDGKTYQVATLRRVLVYPQKTGTLKINPMGLEVVAHIQTGVNRRQRVSTGDPFFDAFFNDPFFSSASPVFERVDKKMKTNALSIEVEELPLCEEVFSGAVGQFELSSQIDTSYCRTNEAITLSYTVSGNGNLTLIDKLKLELPSEFEVYEPNITDDLSKTAAGQSGSRTFQYIIIPRVEGNYTIPAFKFTYFDPQSKQYKTLSSGAYTLNIEKGKNDGKFSEQMSEREKYRNMNITDFFGAKNKKDLNLISPFSSPILYIIIILLIFALVALIRLTKHQIKQREDVVSVKLKKANKVAMKRLKKAKQYLDTNRKEEFETEIGQALWSYLSDKFKIAIYDLSLENIQKVLCDSSLEESTLQNTLKTLNDCEYIRFSQNKESDIHQELYEQTMKTITDIETQMGKNKKRSNKTMKAILAILFCGFSNFIFAQDLSKANQAYQAGDFATALEIYLKAEKTAPNADLYHSIANTYFRMSDYANSVLYYERAFRLKPNDETLSRNHKICRSRLMGEVYVMPDLFLAKWCKDIANLLSPLAWAILFVVLLIAAAILFFLYYFNSEYKVLMFYLCLAVFVLSLSSFGLGFYRQNMINAKDTAIVFSSEAKLVPEKDQEDSSAIKLFKGQKVKIEKQTGKEVFVRTEDGKQGWLDSSLIKVI